MKHSGRPLRPPTGGGARNAAPDARLSSDSLANSAPENGTAKPSAAPARGRRASGSSESGSETQDASRDSETPGENRTAIQVIDRMMRLLDALAAHSEPVSLKDLAADTRLHPSTAHRILNDMVSGRMVDRAEPGAYQLGMRLLELGNLVKGRLSVRERAIGPMRELHRLTGQTVNLSVRQGDEIVYVDRAFSERSGMQVVRAIGGRAPLHLTSVGKLFLAADEPTRVRSYATRTGLAGHTTNSITDVAKLERELQWVRQHACARDNEELEPGVRCIAAGIYDDAARLVAGLSLSAPADRLQESWFAQLSETARVISHALGYVDDPEDVRPRG